MGLRLSWFPEKIDEDRKVLVFRRRGSLFSGHMFYHEPTRKWACSINGKKTPWVGSRADAERLALAARKAG
jgi:hypothetical protein